MTFYIHKDKLKVLPIGVEVPRAPKAPKTYNNYANNLTYLEALEFYEKQLSYQGIEVKNEDEVKWLLFNHFKQGEYTKSGITLKEGEFYFLPDEEFEMVAGYKCLDGSLGCENNLTKGCCGGFGRLAIIKPKSKPVEDEQEESQDDLWMEAINETVKLDYRESRVKWLKERFTIQRKPLK